MYKRCTVIKCPLNWKFRNICDDFVLVWVASTITIIKLFWKASFRVQQGCFLKPFWKWLARKYGRFETEFQFIRSAFGRYLCSKKYQTIWCTLRPIRASSKTFCQSSLSHIIYHTHAWLIVCMIIKHLLNLRPINLNCVSNLPFLWATYFVNILFLW